MGLDVITFHNNDTIALYQNLSGVLCWIIELGIIGIDIYENNTWKLTKEMKYIYHDTDLDFPSNISKSRGKYIQPT